MRTNDLFERTRQFSVRVFRLVELFPKNDAARVIANQLLKSASSVGANYHSLKRAKSRADFGNKMKIVVEECDECFFWLRMIEDIQLINGKESEVKILMDESNELTAIFVSSLKTLNKDT